MPKNIVICNDGTGNEVRKRKDSDEVVKSNVVRLIRRLDRTDSAKQIVFYDPGVGTEGAPGALTAVTKSITKLLGLAFGHGTRKNLADAYAFLMHHYEHGDRIYLFGFSRGAYTVRALAGILNRIGLLEEGCNSLIPYAIKYYMSQGEEPLWHELSSFKKSFSRNYSHDKGRVTVHFMGCWETVNSIGWFRSRLTLPDTYELPNVKRGRHAVAIDEKRSQYRESLWADDRPEEMEQMWFAGAHTDVGGGYEDRRLADFALDWMMNGAKKAGLLANDEPPRKQKDDELPDLPTLHNPLWPVWWLLTWKRRTLPPGARLHESVKERLELTKNDRKPYRVRLLKDRARSISE